MKMNMWRQWGIGLLCALGMACSDVEVVVTTSNNCGSCESKVTPPECEGAADGTPCNKGSGSCWNGLCLPVTPAGCEGAVDGTPCNGGICYHNACTPPGNVPCGVGSGTYCVDAGRVCRDGTCQLQPGELSVSMAVPNTPLSPIDAFATFSVMVSGFINGEASGVGLSTGAVNGLAFTVVSSTEVSSRSFTVLVRYDGVTAFPTGLAVVPFELTGIPEGYALDASGNVTLHIRDGQAKTPERVIWVNQANLQAFNAYAEASAAGRSRHYQLTENVTLPAPTPPELSNWTPIGEDHSRPFTGSFDGDGHTLAGLVMDAPEADFQGMFGATGPGAQIKNLGLTGLSVTGRIHVGGLVGHNEGKVHNSYAAGSVTGVGGSVGGLVGWNRRGGQVHNSYVIGNVEGESVAGGLVGMNEGETHSSYATASVTGTSWYVGGLVGANDGEVRNSYATGSVMGTWYVGGLVGVSYGQVHNSYATGSVKGASWYVGGLVGSNNEFGQVHNSYATGSVEGEGVVGGLLGLNDGQVHNGYATGSVKGTSWYVGGLVGMSYGQVHNGYATGSVMGTWYVGGLVGYVSYISNYSTVRNNVALNPQVSGFSNVGRVAGASYSGMLENNFAFDGMLNSSGGTFWSNTDNNGTNISASQLQTASGFPSGFMASPWTYQPGSLPGLFGQTVAMPGHLSSSP